MEDLSLVRLSPDDGDDVYDMLQHIGSDENSFTNEVHGMSEPQFRAWLTRMDAWSKGEGLPEGYVPQVTYWLMGDGLPVGYGKIRLGLTEASRVAGGNVGYAIDSRFRGRGYGTALARLLIDEARRLGVGEIVLTVRESNVASRRAVERCGARLASSGRGWLYYIA